jgi:hypothetical protein
VNGLSQVIFTMGHANSHQARGQELDAKPRTEPEGNYWWANKPQEHLMRICEASGTQLNFSSGHVPNTELHKKRSLKPK